MGINSDRGQDYGWRLQPEQQALIEAWEEDPDTIDKVANYTKVPMDSLSHAEFLSYMLHLQEAGRSPEKIFSTARRESQAQYDARVSALKATVRPEQMLPFVYNENSTAQVAGDETVLATTITTPEVSKGVSPKAPQAPTEPVTGPADAGDHSANDTPVTGDASVKATKKK